MSASLWSCTACHTKNKAEDSKCKFCTAKPGHTYTISKEKIESFKTAANMHNEDYHFESQGFNWILSVFPNGSTPSKQGNVNCYVCLVSLPKEYCKIGAMIVMTFNKETKAEFHHVFTADHMTQGWKTSTYPSIIIL